MSQHAILWISANVEIEPEDLEDLEDLQAHRARLDIAPQLGRCTLAEAGCHPPAEVEVGKEHHAVRVRAASNGFHARGERGA